MSSEFDVVLHFYDEISQTTQKCQPQHFTGQVLLDTRSPILNMDKR